MGGIASFLVGGGLAWFLLLDIPDIHSVDNYRPQVATIVLDRTGKQVDAIYQQYRIITPLKKMPDLLPKAFVAAEDSRFWEHPGLDLWSILRAGINNIRSGRRSQGGSTITQQVTRSLMLTREKSYTRKITESILAYRLTKMLTKEEILFIYLNEIYLGEGAYGIEAAANRYFGKKASQLSLAEIALLAGLPQAPSRYSPHKKPKAAKARQRYVLNRMAEEGHITAAAARKAYQQELRYIAPHKNKLIAGYFTAHIRKLLAKQYGQKALYREGLTVTTTLDSQLQAHAVRAVEKGINQVAKRQNTQKLPQGALVAMDSRTGRVRALVGGANYQQSQYNRAVDANRQPGSSFKPFIYAAAFENGRQPGDRINDAPFSIRNRDGSVWQPKNYNNRYQGSTSLAEGLIHSNNIVSIKLLQQTGLKPVIQLAQQAGINADLQRDLTLALGSSPVSLLEMTAGYAAFANQGLAIRPVFITSVRDHAGRHRPWPQPRPNKILTPETAQQISRLLRLAVQEGTGRQAAAIKNAAGKTGTSDNNTDAWFIGFSGRLLAGVWLGYDRSQSLGKKETGGRAAAPVWTTFMQQSKN